MDRRCIVGLFLVATLAPAQSPAPALEAPARRLAGEWSAHESLAWSLLRDQSDLLRKLGPGPLSLVFDDRQVPGYAARSFAFRDGAWDEGGARSPAESWVLYLWPSQQTEPPGLVFCLASDGGLLASPNATGYSAGNAPGAEAATAHGSQKRYADLLAASGRATDGEVWETREMLPAPGLNVALVDERGAGHAHYRVALVPSGLRRLGTATLVERAGALPLERPVPAGVAFVDRRGLARLEGQPARGLLPFAGSRDLLVSIAPGGVTWRDARLQLVLASADLAKIAEQEALARANANESAAIATLKNIASAQAQCQASSAIDVNGNGVGEYGFFAELSGRLGTRTAAAAQGSSKISPPVLSSAFGGVQAGAGSGLVLRSGYCFRIWLPGRDGTPVGEAPTGGAKACAGADAPDPAAAEVRWCCYAWPLVAGQSGTRVFYVDQAGDVVAAPNADKAYSGQDKGPAADAARRATTQGRMQDERAANGPGRDGQRWAVVH